MEQPEFLDHSLETAWQHQWVLANPHQLGNLPPVVTTSTRRPWWLYPNLLSLDAPLVAIAWLYMFAKTWRVDYHPGVSYWALGLVVWVIYAADRLLDASMRQGTHIPMEDRHLFHWEHRRWFKIGIGVATVAAFWLVLRKMPMELFSYLTVGAFLVVSYLSVSLFGNREVDEIPLLKNALAGIAFAYGTTIIAHIYLPSLGIKDLVLSREFLCFATLCTLNISAIDLWEHAARTPDPDLKAADELIISIPLIALAAFALLCAFLDREQMTRHFFYAIMTAAALLHMINRARARFTPHQLRMLADLVMIAPLIVFLAFR